MAAVISYYYCLTSNHTGGLNLSYGNSETKYTYETNPPPDESKKETGLGDIGLTYKGFMPMRSMSLIYGLNFNYSGKKTIATADVSGTRNSGGMSFEPQVGIQYKLSTSNVLGAKLNYLFKMSRTSTLATSTVTTELTETGGSKYLLTLFYEKQFGKFFLTPYAGFGSVGEVTTTPATAGSVSYSTKAYTVIPFGFDGLYQMSRNLHLGGFYHGENHGAYTIDTLEVLSYLQHQFGFMGRFLF